MAQGNEEDFNDLYGDDEAFVATALDVRPHFLSIFSTRPTASTGVFC